MIALFVLKLATGITLMWWLMPRRDVTDGFFRIQMRLLLGLAVLAALLVMNSPTWAEAATVTAAEIQASEAGVGASEQMVRAMDVAVVIRNLMIAASVLAYLGSIFWALGRRIPGRICLHLLTALNVAALSWHAVNVPNSSSLPMQVLSDFSSAAVVGSMLTGMLLGHWYLTTPTMSIAPLWWFNRAILTSAALRLVASAWALQTSDAWPADATQQIWLGIRWVGGIVAPALVALLVWRILKHRNTQSATGVLFAGLILVFMGEMTAALLERDTSLPF